MPVPYRFTVFTATYNRVHTLLRVYDSLAAQTYRDFEWLVVDDGSTDDTARLIERWQQEAAFPIRYLRQANQGKHVATNRGVAEAEGELFLVLDSDDACVPQALERFARHWDAVPDRARFSAVTALCMDQHGRLVGDTFPSDVLDSDPLELRYRYKVRGEKWGFQCTDILRRFPFPEDITRTYVPEDIVWNQIAREYRTRYVNERLRVYWVDEPSMVHGQRAGKNAAGGQLQHLNALNTELAWFRFAPMQFLRSALHYSRFSFHLGDDLGKQARRLGSPPARMLWALMLPFGWLVYLRDSK